MYRLCIFAGVYSASSVEWRRDSFSRNRKSFQTATARVLNNILKKGGTEDWRKVLKEATGEDISTRAMMDYFKPVMSWLEEQNKGRQIVGLASAERRTLATMCASTSSTRRKRCLANSASADEQLRGL
jgi:hypothetical protein